jgi:hypothetical protein
MSLDLFPGFSLNVLRVYNLDCVYETWTKTTARLVTRRNIGAHEPAVRPLLSMMWQRFFNSLGAKLVQM